MFALNRQRIHLDFVHQSWLTIESDFSLTGKLLQGLLLNHDSLLYHFLVFLDWIICDCEPIETLIKAFVIQLCKQRLFIRDIITSFNEGAWVRSVCLFNFVRTFIKSSLSWWFALYNYKTRRKIFSYFWERK